MATRRPLKSVTARFVFDEIGDEPAPDLTVFRVDADGTRTQIPAGDDQELTLDTAPAGNRAVLEVGGPPGTDVRRFHYDDLVAHFTEADTYHLPKLVWEGWHLRFGAVSGRVESCRPRFLLDSLQRSDAGVLHRAGLGAVGGIDLLVRHPELAAIHFPRFCRPVCDGTVDVYLRTCCCPWLDPGLVIDQLEDLLDLHPKPKWPKWPIPEPDPVGPLGPVERTARVLDTLARSLEEIEGRPGPDDVLALHAHHQALVVLDEPRRVAYLEAHPALWFLRCHCTLVKVASVPIQEDGTFDAVFHRPRVRPGCTQRVVYVVTQTTPSGPRTIYDGRVVPTTYALGDEPTLKASWTARTCGRDDQIGDVGVFLNRIGTTSAADLVRSSDQDGEVSFQPLVPDDGLVHDGDNVWGATLALRYSFHQDLRGLGARFYRVRVQRVNDAGNAIGAPVDHNSGIAWGRFQGASIVATTLGPNPVGGVANLYEIPYYADGWDFDANSFHAFVDTTSLVSNGRYLFVVDVFDAAGVRLVPTASGGAGPGEATAAFAYQRLEPSADPAVVNLAPVPHKALANLFRVDNTPADGVFLGLRQTGSLALDVGTGCQFLVGRPTDEVQLRYRSHHAAGWLLDASMTVTEGIGGPITTVLTGGGDTGAPPASALTPGVTFGSLLGTDPRCSFAANLQVRTRHTNGSGSLTGLWAHVPAAFALDQTAP